MLELPNGMACCHITFGPLAGQVSAILRAGMRKSRVGRPIVPIPEARRSTSFFAAKSSFLIRASDRSCFKRRIEVKLGSAVLVCEGGNVVVNCLSGFGKQQGVNGFG